MKVCLVESKVKNLFWALFVKATSINKSVFEFTEYAFVHFKFFIIMKATRVTTPTSKNPIV